jgi:hypothetical protein
MNAKFFICYHKNFLVPTPQEHIAVFACGPERYSLEISSDIIDGKDITNGLTLADHNDLYCELTMQFHIWKYCLKTYDAIMFCHYRRYFDLNMKKAPEKAILRRAPSQSEIDYLTSPSQKQRSVELLSRFDFIVPYQGLSVVDGGHLKSVADRMRIIEPDTWAHFLETLLSLFPKYRNKIHLFYERETMHYWNLFGARSEAAEPYFNELFSILRSMQNHFNDSKRKALLPKRSLAYYGEVFFSFYILANEVNVISMPCIQLE